MEYDIIWGKHFGPFERRVKLSLHSSLVTKQASTCLHFQVQQKFSIIDHFTVVSLVTWPLNGRKARVDLVLIQTSLLLGTGQKV